MRPQLIFGHQHLVALSDRGEKKKRTVFSLLQLGYYEYISYQNPSQVGNGKIKKKKKEAEKRDTLTYWDRPVWKRL